MWPVHYELWSTFTLMQVCLCTHIYIYIFSLIQCAITHTHIHRRLCSQIPEQWMKLTSPEDTLLGLVRDISVYCLEHSSEPEACDLLMEIERVDLLEELVKEDTHDRVCLYLTR